MALPTVFRILLVVSFVGAFAGLATQPVIEPHLPQEWVDVIAWDGNRSAIEFENPHPVTALTALRLFGALLILSVVAQVGLFVFWWPARLLYTGAVALSVVIELLVGLSVQPPWESFFSAVAYTCDGADPGARVCLAPSEAVHSRQISRRGRSDLVCAAIRA